MSVLPFDHLLNRYKEQVDSELPHHTSPEEQENNILYLEQLMQSFITPKISEQLDMYARVVTRLSDSRQEAQGKLLEELEKARSNAIYCCAIIDHYQERQRLDKSTLHRHLPKAFNSVESQREKMIKDDRLAFGLPQYIHCPKPLTEEEKFRRNFLQ